MDVVEWVYGFIRVYRVYKDQNIEEINQKIK